MILKDNKTGEIVKPANKEAEALALTLAILLPARYSLTVGGEKWIK